jgi:phage terminase small subunit
VLNEKQKAFAEYYASCFNATESAIKAGYSKKTARSIGQRLLTYVDIKNYIESLTKSAKKSRIATIQEVMEYLSDTMRDTTELRRERTKAAQILSDVLAKTKAEEDEPIEGISVEFEDASEVSDDTND